MSTITNALSSIIYFEQFVREQLETLEAENRTELKEREAEMRDVRLNKARDSRIVEELRPLCEELPPDALDPVTMEPLKNSIVYRCGHPLNMSTVVTIAKTNRLCKKDLIKCPVCTLPTPINRLYPYIPIEGCVEIFEKIKNIFANPGT